MTEARWLDADGVARHLSVKVSAIPRLVRDLRIPKPNYALGPRHPRWDREALDAAFNGGEDSTNARLAVEALASQEAQKSRARRASQAR